MFHNSWVNSNGTVHPGGKFSGKKVITFFFYVFFFTRRTNNTYNTLEYNKRKKRIQLHSLLQLAKNCVVSYKVERKVIYSSKLQASCQFKVSIYCRNVPLKQFLLIFDLRFRPYLSLLLDKFKNTKVLYKCYNSICSISQLVSVDQLTYKSARFL